VGIIVIITLAVKIFLSINYKSPVQYNSSFSVFNIMQFIFPIFFEIIFGVVIFVFVRSFKLGKDIETFNKNYKQLFVLSSLKEVFDNLKYTPDKGVSAQTVSETGLIALHDRFTSNDFISGTYKKIEFEQSDVHVEEREVETDKDGHTTEHWVTTFMGRWMNFEFNKNFRTNVIVVNTRSIFGFGRYKKIKMEDDDFNKNFTVYSEDEHEAYYILTPHFMERLKKIKSLINGYITFGFIDNKLYITIDNYEDSFEHNVFKPIDEEEIKSSIKKDIKVITDFVDELNLNNDLFKEV
jgi:hypothetical protein